MSEDNGWPDPKKPGVPIEPKCNRRHWLFGADLIPMEWTVEHGWIGISKGQEHFWRYLGPALTPAEVEAHKAAATAAGFVMGRDAAANALMADYHIADDSPEPLRRIVEYTRDKRVGLIRALQPPADQSDALAAMLKAAETRGMMRAAKHLENWPVEEERMLAEECAAAIRAAAEGG